MEPVLNLTLVFSALADDTRRLLIHELARGEALASSELGRRLRVELKSIRRHLKVLERAGLIECAHHGRFRLCDKALQAATGWLCRQESLHLRALDDADRRLTLAVSLEHRAGLDHV